MIPWYAQDYACDVRAYPELVDLIQDNAVVFIENAAGSVGDAGTFDSPGHPTAGFYVNFVGMWYEGLGLFPAASDALHQEELFYHSADPSLLQAWRQSATSVYLRWDKDYRFVNFHTSGVNPEDGSVTVYRVFRREPIGVFEQIAEVNGAVEYVDDNGGAGLNPATTYEYKIVSVQGGVSYEFTLARNAVAVGTTVESGPRFWHVRERFQEYAYNQLRHPETYGQLEDPVVWPITFQYSGVIDTSAVRLQQWAVYRPSKGGSLPDPDVVTHCQSYDPVAHTMTFVLSESVSLFHDNGGMAYRLHYDDGAGMVFSYPDPDASGHLQFIRTSVNNRLFARNFNHYMMNMESPGHEWRDMCTSIVKELDDGIYMAGAGKTVDFEAIFGDVVIEELNDTYNRIEPIEYGGQASYTDGVVGLLDNMDANVSSDLGLYINCWSLKILNRVQSNQQITGVVKENWTKDDSWNQNLLPALWVSQAASANWRVCFLEHETAFHIYTNNRSEILAAYMITERGDGNLSRQGILGYGDWDALGNPNITPELVNMVKLLPEQLIKLGTPIDTPYAGVNWPSASEIDVMSTEAQIDKLQTIAPGLFTVPQNGRIFARRRFQHLDGLANDHAVWAIVDVEPASQPGLVSFSQIVGSTEIQNFYYLLDVAPDTEAPWNNVLATEGAGFKTIQVPADSLWESSTGKAVIFFEQPVESPTIGTDFLDPHGALAEYSLPAAAAIGPVLAVKVSQWNGQRLGSVRIAADRALDSSGGGAFNGFVDANWPADVILSDDGLGEDVVADDGIYSVTLPPIPNVALGTYKLPIIVTGTDGLMRFGTVTVEVIEHAGVEFKNGSFDTGDLATTLTGQPYSSVFFTTGSGAGDIDLLLVTKDSSDPTVVPQMFKKTVETGGSPTFDDVTDSYFGFGSGPSSGSRGVCYADYDNDGDVDFFLCNVNQPQLFENQLASNGKFVDVTNSVFSPDDLADLAGAQVAAWGDYNADGWVDLYAATMDYDGTVNDMVKSTAPGGSGTGGGVFGAKHVLFRNCFGQMKETSSLSSFDRPAWSAAWNDVNADGMLDLVVGQLWGGYPLVFLNRGYFKNLGDNLLVEDSGYSVGDPKGVNSLEWIDYDHNEFPDLAVTDFGFSGASILINDGTKFSVAEVLDSSTQWNGTGVADFDQDGQDDVLLLPFSGPPEMQIWSAPGYRNLGPLAGLNTGKTSGVVVSDFNHDGDLDLYLGRAANEEFLYRNMRPGGIDDAPVADQQNFLDVRLATLGSSNASLIGARVLVTKDAPGSGETAAFHQVVDGGSGRGGQRGNPLHFGLGAYTGTVSVQVEWPSGGSMTITAISVAVDHEVLITEDEVPVIVSGPAFTHEPYPGGADWVFTWVTSVKGDQRLDAVEFYNTQGYGSRSSCYAGEFQRLDWMRADVEVSVEPVTTGWGHKLIWKNRPCLADLGCQFEFRVTSGINGQGHSISSPNVAFGNFDVCLPDLPNIQQ